MDTFEAACHADLDDGEAPTTCVLDEGDPAGCVYSVRHGTSARKHCGHWKPIAVQPKAAPVHQCVGLTDDEISAGNSRFCVNCEALSKEVAELKSVLAALDGWADAYRAFQGAFDTPISRRKDDSELAADARRRMSEFNVAMRSASSTRSESS